MKGDKIVSRHPCDDASAALFDVRYGDCRPSEDESADPSPHPLSEPSSDPTSSGLEQC